MPKYDMPQAEYIAWLENEVRKVEALEARNRRLEELLPFLRSVLSEAGMRDNLACYVMGVELMNRLEAYEAWERGQGRQVAKYDMPQAEYELYIQT